MLEFTRSLDKGRPESEVMINESSSLICPTVHTLSAGQDYYNALLVEAAELTQIKRLQSVHNTPARLVSRARPQDHINISDIAPVLETWTASTYGFR